MEHQILVKKEFLPFGDVNRCEERYDKGIYFAARTQSELTMNGFTVEKHYTNFVLHLYKTIYMARTMNKNLRMPVL